jgi:hypothetical protein
MRDERLLQAENDAKAAREIAELDKFTALVTRVEELVSAVRLLEETARERRTDGRVCYPLETLEHVVLERLVFRANMTAVLLKRHIKAGQLPAGRCPNVL